MPQRPKERRPTKSTNRLDAIIKTIVRVKQLTGKAKAWLKTGTIWPYVTLVIIGIAVCFPSLHSGVGFGDDLLFHVYRYHSVLDAIKDHQLLPQLDPLAANGFGHAWNIFYGPLSAYIVTFLRFLTPTWAVAVNTFIVLSVIMSGVFMFQFMMTVSRQKLLALFAAILFMAAPYHLTDIYVRQAHGELLAFVFIPLLFHGIYKIIHRLGGRWLTVAGLTGLILSHNLSSMIVLLFAAMYVAANIDILLPNFKKIVQNALVAAIFVVGLTSFFTLPLMEAKTIGAYNIFDSSFAANYMGMNSTNLNNWSLSPRQMLVNPDPVRTTLDVMPFALGAVTLISLALFVLSYRMIPKKELRFVITAFCLGIVALILTSKLIPWVALPHAVLAIQFPWRFLMMVDFFFAIAGAYGLYYSAHFMFKKIHISRYMPLLIIPLVIGCIASSNDILRFGQERSRWDGTFSYSEDIGTTIIAIGAGEYVPRDKGSIDSHIEHRVSDFLVKHGRQPWVAAGNAATTTYNHVGSHADFQLQVANNKPAVVVLPYIYYPGYHAIMIRQDGTAKHLATSFSDRGFLTLHFGSGDSGKVVVKYGLSKATIVGILLTATTIFFAGLVAFQKYRPKKRKNT